MQLAQKPQRRGAEIFAQQLNAALRDLGHDVRTLYLYAHQATTTLAPSAGDVVLGGQESHPFERAPGVHPFLLHRLSREIAAYAPDIVQANGGRTVKYGAFAKRLCRGHGQWKLVYKNIDDPRYWVRDTLHLWFYRRLVMPRVDGVAGVSQATLDNVRSLYGIAAPAAVILNGRDPRQFELTPEIELLAKQLRPTPDAPVILFLGSLSRQKRPDRFLRVLRKVVDRCGPIEAWVLGDGPLRESLVKQASDLGLDDMVRFFGYQSEVLPYLAACDLLLLTSDSEGTPGAVIEAGMAGKPAVATRAGGTEGCIRDGETGLLVDREDEAGLAAAVERLLCDPAERARMGANAKQWIAGRFTMEVVAAQYLAFYETLLRLG